MVRGVACVVKGGMRGKGGVHGKRGGGMRGEGGMHGEGGACVGYDEDTINERAVRILLECILVDYVEDQLWSLASY